MFGFSSFSEEPFSSVPKKLYSRLLNIFVTSVVLNVKQVRKTLIASVTNTVSLIRNLIRVVVLSITSSVNVALSRVTAKILQATSVVNLNIEKFISKLVFVMSTVIQIIVVNRIYFTELLNKIYIYAEDRIRSLKFKKIRDIKIAKKDNTV